MRQISKRGFVGVTAAAVAIGFATLTVYASNGAATPFKLQYPGFTPASTWTCAGAHVVNKVSIKDSETCAITGDTSIYVAGTFASGEICIPGNPPAIVGTPACGQLPPLTSPDQQAYWLSDFNGHIATKWTIVMRNNGDGTWTSDIVSYYST